MSTADYDGQYMVGQPDPTLTDEELAGIERFARRSANPDEYGAAQDGITDCTPAINAANDVTDARSQVVRLIAALRARSEQVVRLTAEVERLQNDRG